MRVGNMSQDSPDNTAPDVQPPQETGIRLRSVAYPRPFVWAQIFTLVNYCAGAALLTAVPMYFLYPNEVSLRTLIGCTIFFLLSGIVSFFRRRHVLCPLCKGAPLINSRAHVHFRAKRIFPLDYGTSTMLLLIFTQTFRCMYCGAKFDLLKPKTDFRKDKSQDILS